jgi:hypothetical protein
MIHHARYPKLFSLLRREPAAELGKGIRVRQLGRKNASLKRFMPTRGRKLARCGAVESPLDSKLGSNFAFEKRTVSVLLRFRIKSENSR